MGEGVADTPWTAPTPNRDWVQTWLLQGGGGEGSPSFWSHSPREPGNSGAPAQPEFQQPVARER